MSFWDESDEVDEVPICGACGVTALISDRRSEDGQPVFACENADCQEFGEPVTP